MQILDHNGFSWLLTSNINNNVSNCVHMYSSFKVSCSLGDVSSHWSTYLYLYVMANVSYRMLILEAVFTMLASIVASILFGTLLVMLINLENISANVLSYYSIQFFSIICYDLYRLGGERWCDETVIYDPIKYTCCLLNSDCVCICVEQHSIGTIFRKLLWKRHSVKLAINFVSFLGLQIPISLDLNFTSLLGHMAS